MADAGDLKSPVFGRVGSSPTTGTIHMGRIPSGMVVVCKTIVNQKGFDSPRLVHATTEEEHIKYMQNLIQSIHKTPYRGVISVAGGGMGIFSLMGDQPGCSSTLLRGHVCQDRLAFNEYVRTEPSSYASQAGAEALAHAAFQEALILDQKNGNSGDSVYGVGASCAINPGNRIMRGDHRCFVVGRTHNRVINAHIVFRKSHFDRAGENTVCAEVIAKVLGELTDQYTSHIVFNQGVDYFQTWRYTISLDVLDMLWRSPPWKNSNPLVFDDPFAFPDKPITDNYESENYILFPGSFNGLTFAHIELARKVENETGKRVIFSISRVHPHKDNPTDGDIAGRVAPIIGSFPVIVDRSPLYMDKARKFPNTQILMGEDALHATQHLTDYGDLSIEQVLESFRSTGTTFLIASRPGQKNNTVIPDGYGDLFSYISFDADISSTIIRNRD